MYSGGSGSWKYNHKFPLAEKYSIVLETEETEEGRQDEHLCQVILPRSIEGLYSHPIQFHFIPALGRGK